MNYRTVFHTLGNILIIEGIIMILPLITAFIYHESIPAKAFSIAIIIALITGFLLTRIKKQQKKMMQARDGFVIVALSWVAISLIGALPFYLSREIPSFVDALFETVSGFTTTGASILIEIEALSNSLLFWRCFTNWLGGMGILVFMLAVLPLKGESTLHILKAESTGPAVSKIVPRMRESASILYIIYCVLSILELAALLGCGMPLFDSITHTFATAGTGGFSIKNNSIGFYESSSIRTVITIFMFLFGVNFNIYFLLILRRAKEVFKDTELRTYLGITLFAIVTISFNINMIYKDMGKSISESAFTVVSIMTTTGFSTADYSTWHGYSEIILLLLMFSGACAGSTSGGLKISRFILLGKAAMAEIRKLVSPRIVKNITYNGKTVKSETINGVYSYFVIYAVIYVVSLIIVSFNDFDMLTSLSAVVSALNNIGPGFADVGPAGTFDAFSVVSKLVLTFDMLAGRLELFPIVILLLPKTWRKY